MDTHPYKRAAWNYAHQVLGDDLARFGDLVQRIGAGLAIDKDSTDFGEFLLAVYNAGFNKACQDYRRQLAALGYRVEAASHDPTPGSPASSPKAGSPEAARPATPGTGRHATTSYRAARR